MDFDNNTREFIQGMSDQELMQWMDDAVEDCNEAAESAPNSEWHEACFAAVCLLVEEIARRGLGEVQYLH